MSATRSPKRPRIRKRGPHIRCDAFNKTRYETSASGFSRLRSPRCRTWAMPNGRRRLHGGLSTGPKATEGKAAVVPAMVAGRRAWVEKLCSEGACAPGGRKAGSDWIKIAMLKRSNAEARRLGAEISVSDYRSLALTLLRSVKGDTKAKARAALAPAKHQEPERTREEAKAVIRAWQARRAERRLTADAEGYP
jgi:hypothetical protein